MSTATPLSTDRRTLLRAATALPLAASGGGLLSAAAPASAASRTDPDVVAIERAYDLSIGFFASVPGSRPAIRHRAQQRRAMCSVFKTYGAALILRDHDRCGEGLARRLRWTEEDLVEYSPVTELHVDTGLTVAELCEASVALSDNTAANVLLAAYGGPPALTGFVRSIGDQRTRLDRNEPDLNDVAPGDPRDTTTAIASARSYARLLEGTALSRRDQRLLTRWMSTQQTSADALAAGLPAGWTIADKSGSGPRGERNCVGVAWSPQGTPLVLSALTRRRDLEAPTQDAALAELAALAVRRLA